MVRWIFNRFVEVKSEAEVARQLNQRGIPDKNGQPWDRQTVHNLLTNEIYIGNVLFNRRSRYLKERCVDNPEHMWIRSDGAIEPIVDVDLFRRAQTTMKGRWVSLPRDEMLTRLRDTLVTNGRLNVKIINETPGLPSTATYMDHFGTLRNAYRLIGYITKRDWDWIDSQGRWSNEVAELAARMAVAIEKAGGRTDINSAGDCLLVNRALGISFRIARMEQSKKESHSPRWAFYRRRYVTPGWIVALRLVKGHNAVLDYLLFSTNTLVKPFIIRFRDKAQSRFKWERFGTADALLGSIVRRVTLADGTSPTKTSQSKQSRTKVRSKRKPRWAAS